jgi:geranylgeranyl diphosphate synthase type II
MIQESTLDQALKDLFANIQFQSGPEGLYDPLRYMISLGGKRIRPRLCLLTYGIFRDRLGRWILEPAAGLEVFHTFTLIHDDIMDRSALRRGSQTVWKKWNEDTAILSGDQMLIEAYKQLAQVPTD